MKKLVLAAVIFLVTMNLAIFAGAELISYSSTGGYYQDNLGMAPGWTGGNNYDKLSLTGFSGNVEIVPGKTASGVSLNNFVFDVGYNAWQPQKEAAYNRATWAMTVNGVVLPQIFGQNYYVDISSVDTLHFLAEKSYYALGGGKTLIVDLLAQDIVQGNGSYNGSLKANLQVVPVPIPAAVWLLGSGLIGLVGIRRKTRR